VALSPDGKTLAVALIDSTFKSYVLLWDVGQARELARIPVPVTRSDSLAFSGDGKMLAACGNPFGGQGFLILWNMKTGTVAHTIRCNAGLLSVAFSGDGKTVAACGLDHIRYRGILTLWDVATGKETRSFRVEDKDYSCLAISADGRTVAAGGTSCEEKDPKISFLSESFSGVRVWDATSGKLLRTLKAQKGDSPTFSSRSADGKTLAVMNRDDTVRLWDVTTGKQWTTVKGKSSFRELRAVTLTPDGKFGVAVEQSGKVWSWKIATGKKLREGKIGKKTLELRKEEIGAKTLALAISTDGSRLVAADSTGNVHLWDMGDWTRPTASVSSPESK
jgi:WD40 repeat protein